MARPLAYKKRRAAAKRGARAEQLAVWWLRLTGYRVVARNFRHRTGEIDIIARKGRLLVFVEVKYRRTRAELPAALSVRQWQRIAAAASVFVGRHRVFQSHIWRFDVIWLGGWHLPVHHKNMWHM